MSKVPQGQSQGVTSSGLGRDVLQQLLLTHFAYAEQDWDFAVSAAIEAAELSNDWHVYEKPAQTALVLRDYDNALRLSGLWMEKDPNSELAALIFVASQIGLGEVSQALEVANEVVRKNPESGFDKLSQYLRLQSNSMAVTLMEKLHSKHIKSESFLFNAALIAVWFRQAAIAEVWLKETLLLKEDYEPAILLQYEILKANEGVLTALDYLYDRSQKFDKAYAVRNKLVTEWYQQGRYQLILDFSDSVDLQNKKNVELGSYFAQSYIQLEDYQAAKAVLMDLLKVDMDYDPAKFRLGLLFFYDKDYAAAINWFSQVGSKTELFFEANMKIAQSLASESPGELGMKRALRQLNVVDSLTRDQFIRHAEVRDDILQENKRYLRAFAFANEALVNYPNATELLYRRAMSASYIDEIATAENDLKQVLLYRPNDATILNTLGYILVENTQRYAEARLYIEKALSLEPKSYHILDSMGWLLFKLGDYPQARTFLEKAYAADQHPEVAAHLGELLFVQGETETAAKLLRKTIQDHAGDKTVLDTIKRLGIVGF